MLSCEFQYSDSDNCKLSILENLKTDIDKFLLLHPDSKDLLEKVFSKIQYYVITNNPIDNWQFDTISWDLSIMHYRPATIIELQFIYALLQGNCAFLPLPKDDIIYKFEVYNVQNSDGSEVKDTKFNMIGIHLIKT